MSALRVKLHFYVEKVRKLFTTNQFMKHFFLKDANSFVELFLRVLLVGKLLRWFSKLFPSYLNYSQIAFGSMLGEEFIDNPRALFEFIHNRGKFRCVWLTSSRSCYNSLKIQNLNVLYNYSFEAIRFLRKTGLIITGWGVEGDFIPIELNRNTIIIQTWHGSQFKKIFTDIGQPLREVNVYPLYYLLSPSKNINPFLLSAFQIHPNNILITGLPRNDFIYHHTQMPAESKMRLREKYKIPSDKRVILYAPTYRPSTYTTDFQFSLEIQKDLSDTLAKINAILLCKSHFASKKVLFQQSAQMQLVDKYANTQELIILSDILITDYSTLFFDFIFVQKPVIFFVYDYDRYSKYPGLYFDLTEIAVLPIVQTEKDLVRLLGQIDDLLPLSQLRISEIQKKYWDFIDDHACNRVYDFILKTTFK